jgi:PAS domain S-box-containing protein
MRYSIRLVLFIVLINALVLVVDTLSLQSSYQQYHQTAITAAANIRDLLIEGLDEEFASADKTLLLLADEYQRESAAGRLDYRALDRLLRRQLQRSPMLMSMRIADAQGRAAAGPGSDAQTPDSSIADRDYFVAQRDTPHAGLIISKPLMGKVNGRWGIVLSRRLNRHNGEFGGVVIAQMGLDHIEAGFARLSVGAHGSVVLRDAQLGLVVRVPQLAGAGEVGSLLTSQEFRDAIARNPQSDTYASGKSSIDGMSRVHAYGKLPGHPFYVNVGLARDDFLAPWYQELRFKTLYFTTFLLITCVGGWLLFSAWQRREQVLEDFRHSEARTRAIVDAALDAVVQTDARGAIIEWNPSAQAMFGWPKELVLGRDLVDTIAPIRGRQAHRVGLQRHAHNKDPDAVFRSRFESPARHRDGHEFPVEVSVTSMGIDGRREYSAFVRDITALKAHEASERALHQSQERFRLAMEASQEGLWDWDLGADSGYFSPMYYKLLGYEYLEFPMTSQAWSDLIHPDDRERVMAINRDCIENRIQDFATEYRMRIKDGSYQWILGRGSAVSRDADGRALRMIGTHKDISTRKAADQALLAAKAEAEAANNAKSRFLAAASHDLRQPLSAISLYVDVLKARMSPTDDKLLTQMSLCIGSLNTLLTDLLDISRLEAGVVTPAISDFPVADLLSRLVAVHAPAARANGLRLRCRPCGLYARTDPVLMARMLGNLIANAIRYTERGGVLIACRPHAGAMWIEVWDTGIGIAADKTQLIFEEYRQLAPNHPGRGSGSIGSGLGLAIVAKSAALMGLRIRVQSRVGKGSLFAVELPLGAHSEVAKTDPPLARYLRIALVDDSKSILDALGETLRSQRHQVIAASCGSELLGLLGGEAPDVVISDYRLLDGETGTDVIQATRQKFGDRLPALLITGDTAPEFLNRMAAQKITVQNKPLKLDVLLANIVQLTNRRRD